MWQLNTEDNPPAPDDQFLDDELVEDNSHLQTQTTTQPDDLLCQGGVKPWQDEQYDG